MLSSVRNLLFFASASSCHSYTLSLTALAGPGALSPHQTKDDLPCPCWSNVRIAVDHSPPSSPSQAGTSRPRSSSSVSLLDVSALSDEHQTHCCAETIAQEIKQVCSEGSGVAPPTSLDLSGEPLGLEQMPGLKKLMEMLWKNVSPELGLTGLVPSVPRWESESELLADQMKNQKLVGEGLEALEDLLNEFRTSKKPLRCVTDFMPAWFVTKMTPLREMFYTLASGPLAFYEPMVTMIGRKAPFLGMHEQPVRILELAAGPWSGFREKLAAKAATEIARHTPSEDCDAGCPGPVPIALLVATHDGSDVVSSEEKTSNPLVSVSTIAVDNYSDIISGNFSSLNIPKVDGVFMRRGLCRCVFMSCGLRAPTDPARFLLTKRERGCGGEQLPGGGGLRPGRRRLRPFAEENRQRARLLVRHLITDVVEGGGVIILQDPTHNTKDVDEAIEKELGEEGLAKKVQWTKRLGYVEGSESNGEYRRELHRFFIIWVL